MKKSVLKILKICLTTCFAVLMLGAGALLASPASVEARADGTIASNVYQTDGASVRVFQRKTDDSGDITLKETDKQGIRFHVETGANFEVVPGTPLLDVNTKDELNGAYKIADGYTTYTLVLPTRLLNGGDLTKDTAKVLKIDTSGYWHSDEDENWESVAYIYNIPASMYTDNLSFRGIICDSNDNVIFQTEIAERSLTWVAKQAYLDTIDESYNYWDEDDADLDDEAAPLIKKFVPTYSITYNVNGVETTEEVLWGDTPKEVPTEGVKGAWYDTENSEEVTITETMDWTENRTLELHTTSSEEFVLTGVATETDFEVTENEVTSTYHGVKVFATLHREAFADKTKMDIEAVDVSLKRGDETIDSTGLIGGVWTMEETNSLGEWQMLLFFSLDTSKLQSGDKIIISGNSVFYANNVMYKLTEDYTIDYTKTDEVEDYGMYLGDLYNSDVKSLTNCSEDSSGNQGKPDEFTIRVEFHEDVLINGEFTFEFGPDSDTTEYPYPVYIKCGQDENKIIPVSGGRYYWNEGEHKILELIGVGEYANKVFGWHNGDELIAAPGTIVKQNGGYYIFKDQMYGYFLTNGKFDNWDYALGDWLVGKEKAKLAASEFAAEGSVAETNDYGALADEIRINTTTHWFGQEKVNMLTMEKMLDSAPFAIYCTSKDSTVTEIETVRYHGQANPEGGNYQILGLCGEGKFAVGDVVTIAAGTRFWLGTEYYTVTEEITYYYNGNFWVQNYDESTMGTLSSANFGDRAHNEGATETRMYFTAPVAGYTTNDGGAFDELRIGTGSITFNGKSLSHLRYQRWDVNSTWLSFGGYSGSVAFGDKVVIEAGTTIWSANKVAYKFTEKIEWIYAAKPNTDGKPTWSRVRGGVTVSATADNATITGSGMFAVGETYTLNVAPTGDYLISAVIVNNNELSLNASNTYTFTVEQSNTIKVQTVVGHHVTFTIPEGAVVDGGEIANGEIKAVANGGSLTFSVAASEGYKISGVSGATNNGDGTYTVSNVTAYTTITISVEKLYKVTYTGANTMASAEGLGSVANGFSAWVENGTTVTFTIAVNDGYTLLDVSGATKVNATTYTATVNGADLSVTATAVATNTLTNANYSLGIEYRTAWNPSATPDHHYFGITYTNGTNLWLNTASSVSNAWNVTWDASYAAALIANNNGVDIMKYILVNGQDARSLSEQNGIDHTYTGTTGWLANGGVCAPIFVESTTSSGLIIRVLKDFAGDSFSITIKAGFSIIDEHGNRLYVSEDISYQLENGTLTKVLDAPQIDVTDLITITRDDWISGNPTDCVTFTLRVKNSSGDGYLHEYLVVDSSIQGYWNDHGSNFATNNGIDIMEYLYFNGESARSIINKNANGTTSYTGTTDPLSFGGQYSPIAIETNGSFAKMMVLNDWMPTDGFTITIKSGFKLLLSDGNVITVANDVSFRFENGVISKI